MKRVALTLVFLAIFFPLIAGDKLLTPAEEKNFVSYTSYEDVVEFLSRLKAASDKIKVYIAGKTLEYARRNRYGRDIFFCYVAEPRKEGKKLKVLLIASQHGNEQSGVEATLRLLRDIAEGKLNFLLEKMDLIVFPQMNPSGNERDRRYNEQDLDLNRDHIKLEAPEVEALHKVFSAFLPEVTFDMHEKGPGYYKVEIGTVTNPNIDSRIKDFSRKVILKEVKSQLEEKKIPFREYLVRSYLGGKTSYGAKIRIDRSKFIRILRYSTTDINDGRNSFGIFNTFSFIQEVASYHDLETYRERVEHQYQGLVAFLKAVYNHAEEIKSIVKDSRRKLIERASTYEPSDIVHLRMKYVRNPQEPYLLQKKLTGEVPLGIAKRDIKAGEKIFRKDLVFVRGKGEERVVEEKFENWFPDVQPTLSRVRPLGYYIPRERREIADLLVKLGVRVYTFQRDEKLEVEAYRVEKVIPAEADYLPPEEIKVATLSSTIIAKRGDFYVPCTQVGANLISILLEPESQYGLIRYWKFKLVPQPEDIFPIFRVVKKQEMRLIPYRNFDLFLR